MKPLEIRWALDVLLRVDEDTRCVVAWCPKLDVYSQGHDATQAVEAITEAVTLFIRVLFVRKQLDDYLVERGFRPVTGAEPGAIPVNGRQHIEVRALTEVFAPLAAPPPNNFSEQRTIDICVPFSQAVACP